MTRADVRADATMTAALPQVLGHGEMSTPASWLHEEGGPASDLFRYFDLK
ncbi:MAG TPA: hypothetical protein VIK61_07735 [Acidimicrobiia bacterium]